MSNPLSPTANPFVCVLLCTYFNDNPRHLKESVESLLGQTYKNFVLYIGIDGVIGAEASRYIHDLESCGRVRTVRSSVNQGLASILNLCIIDGLQQGFSLFVRADADDKSDPSRLDCLVSFMLSNPHVDCVGSAFSTFGNCSPRIKYLPLCHSDISHKFSYALAIAHATVCFRDSFFKKSGLYTPGLPERIEDLRLWASGFRCNAIFANLPEVLYHVRSCNHQLLRRTSPLLVVNLFFLRLNHIRNLRLPPHLVAASAAEMMLRLFAFIFFLVNDLRAKLVSLLPLDE